MGKVWQLRFGVSNMAKCGVVSKSCQREGFGHIEAKGQILAHGNSQESASHHCIAKERP